MAEPFFAEIKMVGFNFPPRGWALCDGQILPINQFQTLFALLGTTYGGDGRTTFALPDLRGRTPRHFGAGVTLGQRGGEETHRLSPQEMPSHNHVARVSSDNADASTAQNRVLARATAPIYHDPNNLQQMNPALISTAGGGQSHQNMQPYLALNFVIALQGMFPTSS